jgi:hypothetical protein
MRTFIHLANALRADAESLIRLMARATAAPIRPQALKESIALVDVATRIEGRHRASLVLEVLQVRNDDNRSYSSNRGENKQRINNTIPS